MSRTVSSPTSTAIGGTSTKPAYLIQINWSAVTRLTTADASLSWNGYVWAPADVMVSGLKWEKTGTQTGSLTLGNSNQQFSALALNQGVADVAVTIWAYDRSATATGDPVKVFDGVGGRLNANEDVITFALTTQRSGALKCPRMRITAGNGFNLLPAAGSTLRWGAQKYVLTSR